MVVRARVVHNEVVPGGIRGALKRLLGLNKRNVYVGIPQQASSRPGTEINNAELLYIHTHGVRRKAMREEMQPALNSGMKYSKAFSLYVQAHGSPLWHSPPRPVLEPALKYYRGNITAQFAKLVKAAAQGDKQKQEKALQRLGMAGQNAARAWFKNPANGWPANAESTIKAKGSSSPMIDTGTLRKAIVYVVRDE
jgi:hypothetical protein